MLGERAPGRIVGKPVSGPKRRPGCRYAALSVACRVGPAPTFAVPPVPGINLNVRSPAEEGDPIRSGRRTRLGLGVGQGFEKQI